MKRTEKLKDKMRPRVQAQQGNQAAQAISTASIKSEALPSVVTLDENWAHEEAKLAYLITLEDRLMSNLALRNSLLSETPFHRRIVLWHSMEIATLKAHKTPTTPATEELYD